MKRVSRSLFNFAAAVSLILCLLIAMNWARNAWQDWKFNREIARLRARGGMVYVVRAGEPNVYLFPIWTGATAVLPGLWIIHWRRRRREDRKGLCPTCGYDLRAHRTAARNAEARPRGVRIRGQKVRSQSIPI